MPPSAHIEDQIETARRYPAVEEPDQHQPEVEKGAQLAARLAWVPRVTSSRTLSERCRQVRDQVSHVIAAVEASLADPPLCDDARWLWDNVALIYSELSGITREFKSFRRLPHVRISEDEILPRVFGFAQGFLCDVNYQFSEQRLTAYCLAFQKITPLGLREIRALPSALKLALLQEIAERGARLSSGKPQDVGTCVQSLREISQLLWNQVLEPLILFDQVLRQDPAQCFASMDVESRDLYRERIAAFAARSDLSEMEVTQVALALSKEAHRHTYGDARTATRESHIGYYLIGDGAQILSEQIDLRPTWKRRLQALLRRYPDEVFLSAIAILTFLIITGVLLSVTSPDSSLTLMFISVLLLLLPSSQCAVQIVDFVVTTILPAEILPKIDYSKGVSDDCVTLVAVPTLLLSEKQVRGLVEDLEVRFLGNHDANIHFALVSDLPDAHHQDREANALIDLCSSLIQELNEKYGTQHKGSFLLLHRHRIYNPREKRWMGWERKRGKLLDLNKLLRGECDSFPIKTGDVSILRRVRFVITLDSDTELPRGSAHRLIGTLAHPLNCAIVSSEYNIVVAGYGILQPRVGVSINSTARSRLAALYAGETGLDIYTRAVSDVYQDLYGEGMFTGKGIYEVDTVHRVLDRRFPCNELLSHDLLEGAYARAGLVSDVEVIEDYPSHYSAYNRRKHRWLRGDWQIAGWLFNTVRDQSGAKVSNPISMVSRWKILDNLRRSLVEPATFVLLACAWLMPLHSASWTIATILLLFLPSVVLFAFALGTAIMQGDLGGAKDARRVFRSSAFATFLTLVLLANQALLSLDAVIRAVIRRTFTREHLLEWETAAEAEGNRRSTPVDFYLRWTPMFSLLIAILVWRVHPAALWSALPVLSLWASSGSISSWLNRPHTRPRATLPRKESLFLRRAALYTWRYFAQFCTEEEHWLIPDNVQEEPPAVAARVSPTNLGLLLNAQQSACELGYLTVPELSVQTQRTLATLSQVPKFEGHILNWYNTRTLQPLSPQFVSTVDSGNLLASLWTLEQGCLAHLQQPLIGQCLVQGVLDHFRALIGLRAYTERRIKKLEHHLSSEDWLPRAIALIPKELDEIRYEPKLRHAEDIRWFREQIGARLRAIEILARSYAPWQLPEFTSVRQSPVLAARFKENPGLQQMPSFMDQLQTNFEATLAQVSEAEKGPYETLRQTLAQARSNCIQLAQELRSIAAEAARLAEAMDFRFLHNPRRKLLSVGFNVETSQLEPACYDLLATESRTAVFVAVAKDDVTQECWFRMGRPHTVVDGSPILLSWTGTMFEYLMPTLWMRSYPNSLLDRTLVAMLRCQQKYATAKGVPWGVSESAYGKLDDAGNYQYQAFGIPQLSLMTRESNPLVISPYSTFLALAIDSSQALRNIHRMDRLGWFGSYGFYEAADYSVRNRLGWKRCRLVRSWMAHHQGMALLAITNLLCDDVVQRWFHGSRQVQATELLLHEKPVSHVVGAARRAA
jgi:cyclic beta-1,2-glucan synthetase